MPVESANYVGGLNTSYPEPSEFVKQGDDHLRLLKAVLKATFPNGNLPVYFDTIESEENSDFTVVDGTDGGKIFPVTALSGAKTVTLPASPSNGMRLSVIKTDFSPNTVTIAGNGKLINGVSSKVLLKAYQKIKLQYSSALAAWIAEIDLVVETGTIEWSGAASKTGYLLCTGTQTIGDATSGANLTGTLYQALYEHLWNTYSGLTVAGGRGLTANADWLAHKAITMFDGRGYTLVGRANMGGTDSSRLSSVTGTTIGAAFGSQEVTLVRGNLPNTTVSVTVSITDPGHTHSVPFRSFVVGDDGSQSGADAGSSTSSGSSTTGITASGSFNLNGNVTQTAVANLQPSSVQNMFMAL